MKPFLLAFLEWWNHTAKPFMVETGGLLAFGAAIGLLTSKIHFWFEQRRFWRKFNAAMEEARSRPRGKS